MTLWTYLKRPEIRRNPRLIARRMRLETIDRICPPRAPRLADTPVGPMWLPLDDCVSRSYYLYGAHEAGPAAVFSGLVKPGAIVADIGAHVGFYTLLAARQGASLVFAFEPEPGNQKLLRRNTLIAPRAEIRVFGCALSDHNGTGHLSESPASNRGLACLARVGTPVEIRTLDSLMSETQVARIDVMKIDVEGWEEAVLRGAESLITTQRPPPTILFEAAVNRSSTKRTVHWLRSHRFEIFGIRVTSSSVSVSKVEGDDFSPWRLPYEETNFLARPLLG